MVGVMTVELSAPTIREGVGIEEVGRTGLAAVVKSRSKHLIGEPRPCVLAGTDRTQFAAPCIRQHGVLGDRNQFARNGGRRGGNAALDDRLGRDRKSDEGGAP